MNDTGYVIEANSLYKKWEELKDLRQKRGIRYPLPIILTMIALAKMSGEDKPRGITGWLKHRYEEIYSWLGFWRKTPPSERTIGRILSQAIEVETFDRMIGDYLQSLEGKEPIDKREIIAIDGKTLRGSLPREGGQRVQLLAAYMPTKGVTLMQLEVDKKENEIVVGPKLIAELDLTNKVVIGDAMHTQRGFSRQIVEAGGTYVFTVKNNQPLTRLAIERLFDEPEMRPGFSQATTDFKRAETVNKGHGRLEKRLLTSSCMLNDYLDWPFVKQVFRIERQVIDMTTGTLTEETCYGLTSLSSVDASPATLLHINRTYWGIENGLHYCRDVTFGEDASCVRSSTGQHILASLNNLVIGLIRHYQVEKTIPDERRRYCAHPLQALRLLVTSPISLRI